MLFPQVESAQRNYAKNSSHCRCMAARCLDLQVAGHFPALFGSFSAVGTLASATSHLLAIGFSNFLAVVTTRLSTTLGFVLVAGFTVASPSEVSALGSFPVKSPMGPPICSEVLPI